MNSFIELARSTAKLISLRHGEVSADMVRAHIGVEPENRNLWGLVFRGSDWRCIGTRQSATPSAHGRIVKLWKYVA
jgi:hypothetical protein